MDEMFAMDWDCRWKVIRIMIKLGMKLYDADIMCCTIV